MSRGREQRMAGEQVPLTFDDIAVHFSEEEWDYLEEWQKDLHKTVMWENYEALTSLGFQVARPVVQLKPEQQIEVHAGDAEATGEAQIPNKRFSAGLRLPRRRTSSEVSRTAAEGQENAAECRETVFSRNPKIASCALGNPVCANRAIVARNRTFLNAAFDLHSSGCTPSTNQGVPNCSTSVPAAVHPKSTANTAELSIVAGVAPGNTRDLRARDGRCLRFAMKERATYGPVEDQRIGSNFVQEAEVPKSTLEENILPRNVVERCFSPRNSGASTSESSSSEESLGRGNSALDKRTSEMSSAQLRKQRSRTPRTMRLLLCQQRKILRELRDLRRSNEQLQCSIVQVMEEMRRRPENPTTLPTEAGTLLFQEAYPVEDAGIADTELCFINSPPFDTSCQPVAQSASSQGAVKNVAQDNSPYFNLDKHHEILSFNTQQDTSPHIASTPSPSASPQRQTGSMPFDLMAEAMPHNTNSCTSLAESSPRDFPCEPISLLKQEPGTAAVEPVLRAPMLSFPRSARREKHGESLPDIPLPHLSLARQAILLRHSRGEPHTLAKFLFQHYVPFCVYESWVHTTNFDGSRNKRAIPRNLRTEIMRFIASRFRLVEEDKKQIRDRINELLRMPRTGGWPVLA